MAYQTPIYNGHRGRADYSFTIDTDNNSHTTDGGNPTGYFIMIKNTGTSADTIKLSSEIINVSGGPEPDPNEWDAILNKAQVSLNPGNSAQVILNVSTTCGCQVGTMATIRVTGESVNSHAVSNYIDTYTTRGMDQDEVELEPPSMSLFSELIAGQMLDFNLTVINPRATVQSFRLIHTRKPSNWNLTYSSSTFEVEAYSKIYIDVFLRLPLENNPGKYTLGFSVQSTFDPYNKDTIEFDITLLPELAVKKITPSNTKPRVGDKVTFEILVENLGPAVAREFQINIYNHLDMSVNHLIGQRNIARLSGNSEVALSINWTTSKTGPINITVHADPENEIQEVANRYYNNVKTTKINVQPKSSNGGEDGNNNGNGSDSDALWTGPNQILLITVGLIIFIIIILVLLYRSRANRRADSEKTATKIPIRGDGYGRVAPKQLSPSDSGSGKGKSGRRYGGKGKNKKGKKTAKKIRLNDRNDRKHKKKK